MNKNHFFDHGWDCGGYARDARDEMMKKFLDVLKHHP
jgi:hypothetical protein